MPKSTQLPPRRLIAMSAVALFTSLLGLQPWTTNATHISLVVVGAIIGVLWPALHLIFELQFLQREVLNSAMVGWLGAAVLLSPYYMESRDMANGKPFPVEIAYVVSLIHIAASYAVEIAVGPQLFAAAGHLMMLFFYFHRAPRFVFFIGAFWVVFACVNGVVEVVARRSQLQKYFATASQVVDRNRANRAITMQACGRAGSPALVESLSCGTLSIPAATLDAYGVITEFNSDFAALVGLDSDFVVGRSFESFLEWISAEGAPALAAQIEEVLAGRTIQATREAPMRISLRAAGFEASDLEASYSPAGTSHVGRFAATLDVWRSFNHDDAETELVIQRPLIFAVCEAVPVPLCVADPDGTVLHWSASLSHLTELRDYDMLGQNLFADLFGSPDRPMMKPRVYPFSGETRISSGAAKVAKVLTYTLVEWSSPCQREAEDDNRHPTNEPLVCYFERSRLGSRDRGGAHLLASLRRLLEHVSMTADGRPRLDVATGKDSLSSFYENVSQLVTQMAAFDPHVTPPINSDDHHVDPKEDLLHTPAMGYSLSQQPRSVTETTLALRSPTLTFQEECSSPVAACEPPALAPPMPPPAVTVPEESSMSGWGRLTSQDPSVCSSGMISCAMGREYRVGRSAQCALKIRDPQVSSVQFTILRRPGLKEPQVVLVDRSANGTFVNVKRVGKGHSCVLNSGDCITFRLSTGRFFMGFVFELVKTKPTPNRTVEGAVKVPADIPPDAAEPEPFEWRIGEEMLGKGGNGEVYLGINVTNGKLIAVKRVALLQDPESVKKYHNLQEEIKVLSRAKHKNIVQYLGSAQNDTHLHIMLEFVPGGSLRHLLDNFGPFGDSVIIHYVRQILEGLAYLHGRGIVHGDLKCANVLVTDKGEVKLSDFGTARLKADRQSSDNGNANTFTVVGTLLWMAPELIRGETKCCPTTDIWAVGCCLIEMMGGECPWNEYDIQSEDQIGNLLMYCTEPPEIPPRGNSLLHTLAHACLNLNYAERPNAQELLRLLPPS